MCGIAGILPLRGTLGPDHERQLLAMTDALTHRGPDDSGTHFTPRIALGHRRLSIIDTSSAGRQPMATPDGRYHLIFNGENYNFEEIRPSVGDYPFQSNSDSEVVLAHLARRGRRGLPLMAGMYALALWDDQEQELLLVRDRLGEKPLYFATVGDCFYFASEVRSILASGVVPKKLDARALEAYLAFGAVPDPLSIVEGIESLPPGHSLTLREGRRSVEPYWDIPSGRDTQVVDREECRREIRRLLEVSVKGRAISDVPLGAFLSGGVDSGAVTALLAAGSSHPVETFSIAFQVGKDVIGELDGARALAQHVGATHRERVLTSRDVADGLDAYVSGLDQPHADSINTFFVSRFAREHITVALSGLGGDELFAGYSQFSDMQRKQRWGRYWDLLPRFFPQSLAGALSLLPRGERLERFARYQHGFMGRYAVLRSLFDDVTRRGILRQPTQFDSREFFEQQHQRLPRDASLLQQVSYLEMKTYMQHMLLLGTDNSSMAVALEVRVPFLDHPLVEFAARIPDRYKLEGGRGKSILVDAVSDLLPEGHTERPKQGFVFPLAEWLRTDLRELGDEVLSEDSLQKRGLLGARTVSQQWQRFLARDRHVHFKRIWSLIVLELWLRRTLDRATVHNGLAQTRQ